MKSHIVILCLISISIFAAEYSQDKKSLINAVQKRTKWINPFSIGVHPRNSNKAIVWFCKQSDIVSIPSNTQLYSCLSILAALTEENPDTDFITSNFQTYARNDLEPFTVANSFRCFCASFIFSKDDVKKILTGIQKIKDVVPELSEFPVSLRYCSAQGSIKIDAGLLDILEKKKEFKRGKNPRADEMHLIAVLAEVTAADLPQLTWQK